MSIFTKRSRPAKIMVGEVCLPFFHTSGWVMSKYISIQYLNQTYHAVQDLWAFSPKKLDWPKWCSVKPRHIFSYHWLDNVQIQKYTKFEPNIPWGSRVVSIFTKRARKTDQNDARWSLVTFFHTSGWTMLKYISIQNLNQTYHPVQEL